VSGSNEQVQVGQFNQARCSLLARLFLAFPSWSLWPTPPGSSAFSPWCSQQVEPNCGDQHTHDVRRIRGGSRSRATKHELNNERGDVHEYPKNDDNPILPALPCRHGDESPEYAQKQCGRRRTRSSGIRQPPPMCYGARLRVGACAGSLAQTPLASVWVAVRYAWLLAPRCSEPAADTGTTRNEHNRRDAWLRK
jgi:hypothetical protein